MCRITGQRAGNDYDVYFFSNLNMTSTFFTTESIGVCFSFAGVGTALCPCATSGTSRDASGSSSDDEAFEQRPDDDADGPMQSLEQDACSSPTSTEEKLRLLLGAGFSAFDNGGAASWEPDGTDADVSSESPLEHRRFRFSGVSGNKRTWHNTIKYTIKLHSPVS